MAEKSGIFTFLELPTITLPLVMNDLASIISFLGDILSMKELHVNIKMKDESRSASQTQQFPYDLIQTTRTTLPISVTQL